jgi:hypothetical protein
MLSQTQRRRTLLVGSDLAIFYAYVRHHSETSDEICAFLHCTCDPPPFPLFQGVSRRPLRVYPLRKLETVVAALRIQRAVLIPQNLPTAALQAIVYRITAIRSCQIEFTPHDVAKVDSFKPIIAITSLGPGAGKSTFAQYITIVFASAGRRVAVVIPENDCPERDTLEATDTFVAEIQLPRRSTTSGADIENHSEANGASDFPIPDGDRLWQDLPRSGIDSLSGNEPAVSRSSSAASSEAMDGSEIDSVSADTGQEIQSDSSGGSEIEGHSS